MELRELRMRAGDAPLYCITLTLEHTPEDREFLVRWRETYGAAWPFTNYRYLPHPVLEDAYRVCRGHEAAWYDSHRRQTAMVERYNAA